MLERHGAEGLRARFRAFDTICSATQDRQDAVLKMLARGRSRRDGGDRRLQQQQHPGPGPDLRRAAAHVPHPWGRGLVGAAVPHRPVGVHSTEAMAETWLPEGRVTVGLTAGASTPNNVVGEVVERVLALRGHTTAALVGA